MFVCPKTGKQAYKHRKYNLRWIIAEYLRKKVKLGCSDYVKGRYIGHQLY